MVLKATRGERSRSSCSGARPPRRRRRRAGATIRGRVEVRREPRRRRAGRPWPSSARTPPHDAPRPAAQRRLPRDRAAAGASSAPAPRRAVLDQRNETFVPYVLAVTVGLHGRLPEQRPHLPQRVLALEDEALRPRAATRAASRARCASTARRRARVLRDPLAHERLDPGLRAPLLRDAPTREGRYRIDGVPPGSYTLARLERRRGARAARGAGRRATARRSRPTWRSSDAAARVAALARVRRHGARRGAADRGGARLRHAAA